MGKSDIEGGEAVIVYTNGCSYAGVSDGKRYSEFLGESLGCKSINAAISGSCNSRILRSSIRDLINLKKEYNSIVVVISLTFMLRTEIWDKDPQRQDEWTASGDGDFISYQFAKNKNWFSDITSNNFDPNHIPKKYHDYGVNWLSWYDIEAETTKLLQQILLFTSWCKYNNIRTIVFSGPLQETVNFDTPFISTFYKQVLTDQSVINIFAESFTEWCNTRGYKSIDTYPMTMIANNKTYDCGHHGELAHQAWAIYLLENYLKDLL